MGEDGRVLPLRLHTRRRGDALRGGGGASCARSWTLGTMEGLVPTMSALVYEATSIMKSTRSMVAISSKICNLEYEFG